MSSKVLTWVLVGGAVYFLFLRPKLTPQLKGMDDLGKRVKGRALYTFPTGWYPLPWHQLSHRKRPRERPFQIYKKRKVTDEY